jgi:hypothetical protein
MAAAELLDAAVIEEAPSNQPRRAILISGVASSASTNVLR